jgi:uncharacterized protein (DUF433 family)
MRLLCPAGPQEMLIAPGMSRTLSLQIAINKTICGGSPVIKGTRVSVANIAGFYLMGFGPEEIQKELQHPTLAQVYDAIANFLDHRAEINRLIQKELEETVSAEFPAGKF